MLPSLLIALALANSGNTLGVILEGRAQSQAKCSDDFTWAQNSKEETPCLVAARILGFCTSKDWNIPALDSTHHYTPPNSTTKNPCSCSWATYNLLGACTACQGFDLLATWPGYKINCASVDLSDTGYPFAQLPLPPNTAIPYWAMTDPLTWPDQKFDVATAKALDEKGQPDTVGNPPPPKKTSTVGPIVGGVIGGLVAVGLALGAAFYMKSRKKKQHRQGGAIGTYGPAHARQKSDLSQISQTSGTDMTLPYTRIQSPQNFATTQLSHPPMSIGSNSHTRNGSVNSFSYFGSVNGSVAYSTSPSRPPQRQLSPSPPHHPPTTSPENVIVPFILPHLTSSQGEISRQGSSTNLADRKRADGAIISSYDQPSAPPHVVASDDMLIVSTSKRPKVNPPAYSPYPHQEDHGASSQAPARSRPPHTKQGSADTQHSWDSGRSGGTARPGGGGSISTIGDVIGQMGIGTTAAVSRRDGTVESGQSGNMAGTHGGQRAPINPDGITRHNLA